MAIPIPSPKDLKDKADALDPAQIEHLRTVVAENLYNNGHQKGAHVIDVAGFSDEAVDIVAKECHAAGWFVRRDDRGNLILRVS